MRPLEGIRVLELGQVIAAPYAGLVLADLGATVIKVERPGSGDSARDVQVTSLGGHSATFLTFNRNKRSVTVDLRSPQDRERFLTMVDEADVVLTNLLPGAAQRLGVDPATLRARNPRLVTCLVSGYGGGHPASDLPSYDLVHQALAGYLMINGLPTEPPSRVGIPIADLASGLFATLGIVSALRAREVTGRGDAVDISMYDSLLSLLSYQGTMYLTEGTMPERNGTSHEFVVPWRAFPTADGELVVAVRAHHFWVGMCRALELDDLVTDPRFVDNLSRLRHREEIEEILAARFRTDTTAALLAVLNAAGVPCAEIRDPGTALDDANLRGRDLISSFDLDGLEVTAMRAPIAFAESGPVPFVTPPELGEMDPAQHALSAANPVAATADSNPREESR